MTTHRLAHYSDIHYTLPPLGFLPRLFNKRMAGTFNHYVGGRGLRFKNGPLRIRRLLDDVDAQQVDHAVCTGDLTAVSLWEEFEGCAALFGKRLEDPSRLTVLPGNHDRYVEQAVRERYFERFFGRVSADDGGYPHLKEILPGVMLVSLDVARPTPVTHSSGLCGEKQMRRAEELLSDPSMKDRFVIVAMHYGLLRAHGGRDRPTHGIRDDEALLAMLDAPHVNLDLVVHGHMHGAFSVRSKGHLIHCAGSATDLAHACGYNIYTLDTDTRDVRCERRTWQSQLEAYGA
jgi:3',5'-cyclic AMP phosphodiesterase CpdA